jgi:hypothetical protein
MLALVGNNSATTCALHTYRAGDGLYDAAADAAGVPCTPCPTSMQTLVTGSSSDNACLAPPGYGWDSNTMSAALCARGTYSPGWSREACTACGGGTVTTDALGATHVGACKVLAGHGTSRADDGTLSAAACPVGTFGRPSDTYGLVDVECTKCLEFSTTAGNGSTTGAQCTTLPGYGWYNGAVQQCEYAYFSPGGLQEPCGFCGEGYNTSTSAAGISAVQGADARSDCVIAAGWTRDGAGGIKPCVQGYYKSDLGNATCSRCPSGTTTTITIASAFRSDCDACRAGFGAAAIDLSSPNCTICASGKYSFGYVTGGQDCVDCPKPDGYTGLMVSRRVSLRLFAGCSESVWSASSGRAAGSLAQKTATVPSPHLPSLTTSSPPRHRPNRRAPSRPRAASPSSAPTSRPTPWRMTTSR